MVEQDNARVARFAVRIGVAVVFPSTFRYFARAAEEADGLMSPVSWIGKLIPKSSAVGCLGCLAPVFCQSDASGDDLRGADAALPAVTDRPADRTYSGRIKASDARIPARFRHRTLPR